MAANQLDLIMSQVQQLSASEQLQIIKRIADLLGHADQQPHNEAPLAALAADPNIQRELRQSEAETNGVMQSKSESLPPSKPRAASLRDFTADRQWLAEHRDEYAGQWVALKDGQLISYGLNAKEVHHAAQSAGHSDALLVRVEASDVPPFIL